MRVLIIGLSTRAIAESAVQSEHQIITLDYFGDRDQRVLVENLALSRDFDLPFSAQALRDASQHLDFEALVYVSNLENHPQIIEELARDHILLGNTPESLRRVRDWHQMRSFCRETGIHFPTTLLPGEESQADPQGRWLRKPIRSGGGHAIRLWKGEALDGDHFLQAYVAGQAASAAFVADGEQSVLLGLTEQLIGQEELGAGGFGWCGNILPLADPPAETLALLEEVEAMIASLTRRFGLRGVNGIDLIVTRDEQNARGRARSPAPTKQATRNTKEPGTLRPYLVEVNPRYTASMELLERAYGLNIFSLHLKALAGKLLDFSLREHIKSQKRYFGKGIVYARRDVTAPETANWMERGRRDVPFPGERIKARNPVCTVLAEGESRAACWQNLITKAEGVRQEVGDKSKRTGRRL